MRYNDHLNSAVSFTLLIQIHMIHGSHTPLLLRPFINSRNNAADQSAKELTSLKERNKALEEEMKELHERYSEISLRFAEVEGERQQLVMMVRSLKNSLR
jgi:chromosome segregation ATPase